MPYLLRGLRITHRNQVWSTDISYIPMENGFMYLYAIIDVNSRYIVATRALHIKFPEYCMQRPEIQKRILGSDCKNNYLSTSKECPICRALPREGSASHTELT